MAGSGRRAVLRVVEWRNLNEQERTTFCARGLADIFDPALRASIAELIDDVRTNGDDAVCRALEKFDGVKLRADQLVIGADAIASARVSPDLESALSHAITNLRTFNEKLMERASNWSTEIQPGLSAGERITPVSSAGLFVPSGKASYPSVAYQLGVPAVVARVPDIALLVPPQPGTNGEVDPAILVVCRMLGISRVYRANGPAGIAALGFGTASIAPVRKIV
ncbi:MAG: histidinol dehydrogenase, partial [Actinomycetota bacterium]